MRSLLVAFLLLCGIMPAMASTSDPMSIVEVSTTDKSVEYLRYIFGNTVNVITGGTGPQDTDSVLGAMSSVLCAGMLLFTGIIIIYTLLTGLLDSANEGNPLGKALSTMWVPLRMVLAMGLVLPLAGGFSAMQVGVLWVAGHGIGLANTVWNESLDHIQTTGSMYPPDVSIDFEGIAAGILQSRTCLHAVNHITREVNIVESPYSYNQDVDSEPKESAAVHDPSFDAPGLTVMQRYTNAHTGPEAASRRRDKVGSGDSTIGDAWHFKEANPCGSVAWHFTPADHHTDVAEIKVEFQLEMARILAKLDDAMDPLAREIVYQVSDGTGNPDETAFLAAVEEYKAGYFSAAQQAMTAIATFRTQSWADGNPENAQTTIGARDAGWITAGAWYWDLQKANAEAIELVRVTPSYQAPGLSVQALPEYTTYTDALEAYHAYRIVYDSSGHQVTAMERSSYMKDDDVGIGFLLTYLSTAAGNLLKEPDPVTGLQNFGHTIIVGSEIAWESAVTAAALAEAGDASAAKIPFPLGAATSFGAAFFKTWVSKHVQLLVFALIALIPLALFLAFYLPATPLILWVSAVAGWFVLLIEAVIAAPIWAASHAMPEGNGFVGQRAMAGYMVLLSLFLRPTLMLFGFFASMLLMIAMAKVVTLLFVPAMSSLGGGYIAGVATIFGNTAVLVFLIIHIAHRAYGLIHEIPDKILRYIGGGAENLGEADQERQAKSFFVAGASKIESSASGSMRRASDMGRPAAPQPNGDGKDGAGQGNSKLNKDLSTTG